VRQEEEKMMMKRGKGIDEAFRWYEPQYQTTFAIPAWLKMA
jgi:hypothetical protein